MSLARSIFGGGKPTPSAIDRSNTMMQSIFDYAGKNPGMVGLKDDGLGLSIDTGTGMINLGQWTCNLLWNAQPGL